VSFASRTGDILPRAAPCGDAGSADRGGCNGSGTFCLDDLPSQRVLTFLLLLGSEKSSQSIPHIARIFEGGSSVLVLRPRRHPYPNEDAGYKEL
jgi:hypothetical protein